MCRSQATCRPPHATFSTETVSRMTTPTTGCVSDFLPVGPGEPQLSNQRSIPRVTESTTHPPHVAGRSFHAGGSATRDTAIRIVSETAHDLRSPLTAIRESIRLVHDGDLGPLSDDQQSCLAGAIDQCECIDQMVGDMVQLDRMRTGLPRARRRQVSVTEIRQSVDATLQPWAVPRNIMVVWDGADDPQMTVFADPLSLRRMIVNLVTNAIRVTGEGECVLIALRAVRGGEAIEWSVIDQGTGIAESDMRQIAASQVSTSGSEGLGLMICRQLAALHFSQLRIRSRLGTGTEVSFETATSGPQSVAACWTRWRRAASKIDPPLSAPLTTKIQQGSTTIRPPRRSRLNPPSVKIEITCDGETPRCETEIAVGTVSLGAAMSRQAADEFDTVLQNQLRMFELLYRVDTRRWVWIFDADYESVLQQISTISDTASRQIANVRLTWSRPQILSLQHRHTAAVLSDMLVREVLSACSSGNVRDNNEVRLGTPPIGPSDVAANRLDGELRRLTGKLRGQTTTMRQQAKRLRRKV